MKWMKTIFSIYFVRMRQRKHFARAEWPVIHLIMRSRSHFSLLMMMNVSISWYQFIFAQSMFVMMRVGCENCPSWTELRIIRAPEPELSPVTLLPVTRNTRIILGQISKTRNEGSFKIDVQVITYNYSPLLPITPFAFPENQDCSQKAESCPRLMCVTCPGPQHSQRCLSLSGPALQSLSPDQAAGLLALGWAWVSPDCVSVSEVSPALRSSVTTRAQAREHIGTSVQPPPENTQPSQIWWQNPCFHLQ